MARVWTAVAVLWVVGMVAGGVAGGREGAEGGAAYGLYVDGVYDEADGVGDGDGLVGMQECTGCQLVVQAVLERVGGEVEKGGGGGVRGAALKAVVEGVVATVCDGMGGAQYASVGHGSRAKFVPFAGFAPGHSFDNLSVGRSVDAALAALCTRILAPDVRAAVTRAILTAPRVYDASLAFVCAPSCAPSLSNLARP